MASHSSTLAWKIPWMEDPGRVQSMGSLWVRHKMSDFTFTFHFHALEKEMATHSSVLAWRITGMGEPGGLLSMGSHRVGHDWSDLAVAACKREAEGGLTQIKRESKVATEPPITMMWLQAKECQQPPEAGQARTGSFLRASWESMALPTPWFGASEFQNYERTNFYCF